MTQRFFKQGGLWPLPRLRVSTRALLRKSVIFLAPGCVALAVFAAYCNLNDRYLCATEAYKTEVHSDTFYRPSYKLVAYCRSESAGADASANQLNIQREDEQSFGQYADWIFARPGDKKIFYYGDSKNRQSNVVYLTPAQRIYFNPTTVVFAVIAQIGAIRIAAALLFLSKDVVPARLLAAAALLAALPVSDGSLPQPWGILAWFVTSCVVFIAPILLVAFTTQYPHQEQTPARKRLIAWLIKLAIVALAGATIIDVLELADGNIIEGPLRALHDGWALLLFGLIYIPVIVIFSINAKLVFDLESDIVRRQFAELCIPSLVILVLLTVTGVCIFRFNLNLAPLGGTLAIGSLAYVAFVAIVLMRQRAFGPKVFVRGATAAAILALSLPAVVNVASELFKEHVTAGSQSTGEILLVFAVLLSSFKESISAALTKPLSRIFNNRDASTAKITEFADEVGCIPDKNAIAQRTVGLLRETVGRSGAAVIFLRNDNFDDGSMALLDRERVTAAVPCMVSKLYAKRAPITHDFGEDTMLDIMPIITGKALLGLIAFAIEDGDTLLDDERQALQRLCLSLCATLARHH